MVNRYGLIGYPLGHSFSARYFTEKFAGEHISALYELYPIPDIKDLTPLIHRYRDLKGLNVTIPYKRKVLPFLDSIDITAQAIGAVNVIKIERLEDKVSLKGYNTDAPAFSKTLDALDMKPDIKALVLGSGGAADAVCHALESRNIAYHIVSRSPSESQLGYDRLSKDIVNAHKLIINCTPVGMFPDVDASLPFPYDFLDSSHICYDLIYNPSVTTFMKESAARGAWVKNGLQMLMLQAELAWKIWTNPS